MTKEEKLLAILVDTYLDKTTKIETTQKINTLSFRIESLESNFKRISTFFF
jgi:hypothetical protein